MNKIINVYRVESLGGKGFYSSNLYKSVTPVQYWYPELLAAGQYERENILDKYHPNIPYKEREEVYEQGNPFVFGCSSATDFVNWFPYPILHTIESKGGILKKFSIDEGYVVDYPKQCIFQIACAEKVEVLTALDVLNEVKNEVIKNGNHQLLSAKY